MNDIQKELLEITGAGQMSDIIRDNAKDNLIELLKFIKDKAGENRPYMVEIIGENLLKKIESL